MPVRIAEYLGQRVDAEFHPVRPSVLKGRQPPTCPFTGAPCSKLSGKLSQHPVCSVRRDGEVFVVCSDRLLPARTKHLTTVHLNSLCEIGSVLFPGIKEEEFGFRRQVGVKVGPRKMVFLDYVLATNRPTFQGRQKVILEIQGGGETGNTGTISHHVQEWIDSDSRTNEGLGSPLASVRIIPNNAWKRQLEQIFRKGPLANQFGGAFALALGTILYDYVAPLLTGKENWYPDWEMAIVELRESTGSHNPLQFEPGRRLFMSYSEFVECVSQRSSGTISADPFLGTYTTSHNNVFEVR